MLGTTGGAADRDREGVAAMLDGSDVVGFVDDEDRLVAFARALTDGTYRAFVYDVVVVERLRGQGLGHRVVEVADPFERPYMVGVFVDFIINKRNCMSS